MGVSISEHEALKALSSEARLMIDLDPFRLSFSCLATGVNQSTIRIVLDQNEISPSATLVDLYQLMTPTQVYRLLFNPSDQDSQSLILHVRLRKRRLIDQSIELLFDQSEERLASDSPAGDSNQDLKATQEFKLRDFAAVATTFMVVILGAYVTPAELWLKVLLGMAAGLIAFFGMHLVFQPKTDRDMSAEEAKFLRKKAQSSGNSLEEESNLLRDSSTLADIVKQLEGSIDHPDISKIKQAQQTLKELLDRYDGRKI